MLAILGAVLYSFQRHINYQLTTPETVWAIEFSPDGGLLVRASNLGVTVFDLNTFSPTDTGRYEQGATRLECLRPGSVVLIVGCAQERTEPC
jgi:hypothetical protein